MIYDPTREVVDHEDLENVKVAWKHWNKSGMSKQDKAMSRSMIRAAFYAGYRYAIYDVEKSNEDDS